MKILQRLQRALRAGHVMAFHAHTYWRRCDHCDTTGPWITNAWTGEYRCMHCGADQLD